MTDYREKKINSGTVQDDAEQYRLDGSGEAASQEDEALNDIITSLCNSKAEEFQLFGYEHVTGQEVWECVSESYSKKGLPRLHEMVNDILSLKVTRFMNWLTMQAYKSDGR